jgi:hypothetical protein
MLIAIEPVHGFRHGRSIEPAGNRAALLGAADEASIGKNFEMLEYARERH